MSIVANRSRTQIRLWTHERGPIPPHHGWAMRCLLLILWTQLSVKMWLCTSITKQHTHHWVYRKKTDVCVILKDSLSTETARRIFACACPGHIRTPAPAHNQTQLSPGPGHHCKTGSIETRWMFLYWMFQYHTRCLIAKSWSHETCVQNCHVTLKVDRHLNRTAAHMYV